MPTPSTSWKEASDTTAGDSTKYGVPDGLLLYAQLFNGDLNVDNVDINSPWFFRSSKCYWLNPAGTFTYQMVAGPIVADRLATLPTLTTDDTFVFSAHAQDLGSKRISNRLDFDEVAAPSSPATGDHRFYMDSADSFLKSKNDAGGVSVYTTNGGTQTLTNKTITQPTMTILDNAFTIQDNADNSKQAVFELSGISASTTRTYTVPNYNATLASLAGVEAFTNKGINITKILGVTPTSATIATGVIAGTTTGITVDAEGAGTDDVLDTITGYANGDIVRLVAESGQIITVTHDFGGADSIHLRHKINIFLSETVPLVLQRRGGEFYEIAGPEITIVELAISIPGTALATGDNQANFICDKKCRLIKTKAYVDTVSSSGLPTFALRKNTTDMLTTSITIDANENSSLTAATPPVIKSDGSQICAADDVIRVDCDVAGTGTKGGLLTLWFENISDE